MVSSRTQQIAMLCCAGIFFLAFVQRTQAVITLDADFDHGSLCLVPSNACDDNGVASSVIGNQVTLIGRDNFNPGQWKWVYFKASGVNGEQVDFEIGSDFNTGFSSLANHKMVYSYDQESWQFFDNNDSLSGPNRFAFSNNSAFNQDDVYVAYGLPYSYQRVVSHTQDLTSNPWVSSTTSGAGSLVVGQSPGGTDDIGRSVAPHDLFGYKITDDSATGPKKKVVLASGVHSNETLGNHQLEGLVDFLVGDSLEAAQLRRYAEFYVYPMANPDGRFAGYNRSTVQMVDEDPNRHWNLATNYGGLLDIRQVGQAMRFDTGSDADYVVDFHSTVNPSSAPYHFGYVHPDYVSDPFWLAVQNREPNVVTNSASLSNFTLAKFGRDELNADFSITFETRFIADENEERFAELGENFGLAWHDAFFVFADLNFDGQLNIQDWLILNANSETNLSAFSAIEKYARGDLDGDGLNSTTDFVMFQEEYIQLFGNAAWVNLVRGIPEPSTAMLCGVSYLLIACGHRQRRSQVSLCSVSA